MICYKVYLISIHIKYARHVILSQFPDRIASYLYKMFTPQHAYEAECSRDYNHWILSNQAVARRQDVL